MEILLAFLFLDHDAAYIGVKNEPARHSCDFTLPVFSTCHTMVIHIIGYHMRRHIGRSRKNPLFGSNFRLFHCRWVSNFAAKRLFTNISNAARPHTYQQIHPILLQYFHIGLSPRAAWFPYRRFDAQFGQSPARAPGHIPANSSPLAKVSALHHAEPLPFVCLTF